MNVSRRARYELFDLESDPAETENLAAVRAELMTELLEEMKRC